MPRENITTQDGRAYVGWTPGRDVQVGVQLGAEASADGVAPGLFTTLADRAAVNRLIRTLRRARDAAFGADA